jgi:hypothetical protein
VITQSKRDNLIVQAGGWAWCFATYPVKFEAAEKLIPIAAGMFMMDGIASCRR